MPELKIWQQMTVSTVKQLKAVIDLDSNAEQPSLDQLLTHARTIALGLNTSDPSKFWNLFINTLRTLIAATRDIDAESLFDESSEHESHEVSDSRDTPHTIKHGTPEWDAVVKKYNADKHNRIKNNQNR